MIDILEYTNLAYKFSNKYRKRDIEDGMQDAYVALLDSARSFDISRGNKFITHTYKRVMGYVIYNQSSFKYNQISIGHLDKYNIEQRSLFIRLNKFLSEREIEILISISIHELGLQELSNRYNISKQRIFQIYKKALKKCKDNIQL